MKAWRKNLVQLKDTDQCLLALLQMALFHDPASWGSKSCADWPSVIAQARSQTVVPMVYDAIMKLPQAVRPSEALISELRRETLFSIASYEHLLIMQDEVLSHFSLAHIPCAILKGASAAVHYPKPELRMMGDIDVLVEEADLDKASQELEKRGFRKNDTKHECHITFEKAGVHVELHHAVSVVPDNPAGDTIRHLMRDAVHSAAMAALDCHRFPVLSKAHQAVSLLLHMQKHITSSGLGLRQLCDWAVFIKWIDKRDWESRISTTLKCCGLYRLSEILTKTCVLYLGLDKDSLLWCMHIPDALCLAVIQDFLNCGNFGRGDPAHTVSGTLVLHGKSHAKRRFFLRSILSNLNDTAYRRFPLCKKVPILLPFLWAFFPLRYFVRMQTGKRPKQSIKKILVKARQRDSLYESFELFK